MKIQLIKIAGLILIFSIFSEVNAQERVVNINVSAKKTHQHIDNFGASDAWACQFVGKWPKVKKERIADLLFSGDTLKDGSPKGIALSLWRFNIGGGSAEQGDKSGIKDEWRRSESFLASNGVYDWKRQAGQVWFLKAAKARGVNQFLGFLNSPPINYTINGKAYATAGKSNLALKQETAFANYITSVVKGIDLNYKIKLNYISPVNEPQWDWSDGGQEGCPYTNRQVASLVKVVNSSFIENRLNTQIIVPEAGAINYLFAKGDKPGKGNQINNFFCADSVNYIGDLTKVARIVAGHSYFTTSPLASALKLREALSRSIKTVPNLRFWQSEYCILGDNNGEVNGHKRDLGISAAIYLAKVIHNDLTVANASAWQWWTAISAYDYKDGLIYIDKNKVDGNYYTSKMLWALGNYSRFIRPGSVRIDAVILPDQQSSKDLQVSAFKNGNSLTLVIINQSNQAIPVNINMIDNNIINVRSFTTSVSADLKAGNFIEPSKNMAITAQSITTITATIQ